MMALRSGNSKIYMPLLEKCSLNVQNQYGQTALHFAVKYDRRDAVKRMIARGTALNMKDTSGVTPLMVACGFERYEEITDEGEGLDPIRIDERPEIAQMLLAAKCNHNL